MKIRLIKFTLLFLISYCSLQVIAQETVTIGNQVWMLKNLDVITYRNGDTIPGRNDGTLDRWMYYNDDPSYGPTYGRLYTWYAVTDPRGIAPEGWHVPTEAEWITLVNYLGGTDIAGGKLKETGTVHWVSPNVGATNESGFSALGAGHGGGELRVCSYWWTSTSFDNFNANCHCCYNYYDDCPLSTDPKTRFYSVRLISDVSLKTSSLSLTTYCAGLQISIPFTITGIFNVGNIFTGQLSNSAGNFASPITIGTLAGTSAGTIVAAIPPNTASGTGYRVRVVSSSPAFTGTDNGVNITIYPKPNPSITGNNTACEKSILSFNTTNSGNAYKWSTTNGTVQGASDGSSVNVQMGTGDSTVIKIVETIIATGCKDSVTKTVHLNLLPKPSIQGSNSVCEKSLNAYSTTNVSGDSYKWLVTNGIIQGVDNTSNVTVQWNAGTTGTLKVIETTTNACKDSATSTINLNPLPTPSISPTSDVCANNSQIYTTILTPGHTYKWSVLGGTISGVDNTNNVNITWGNGTSGTIKVIETITATGCKDSVSKTILINPLPAISISGPSEVCEKSNALFSTTNNSNYSFNWSVTNGFVKKEDKNEITIVCGTGATSTIKVIVTDNSTGCKDSATKNIKVNPFPLAQINGNLTVCQKNQYSYATNNLPDMEYSWSAYQGVIVGSSTSQKVDIVWSTPGTGGIVLVQRGTKTGCKDSVTTIVNILSLPKVVINGSGTVQKGSTQTYTSTATNVSSIWSVNGGAISGSANGSSVTTIWGDIGKGKIKLIQSDLTTGCKDSTELEVDINSSNIVILGAKSVCEKNPSIYSTPPPTGRTNLWSVIKGGTISGPNDGNWMVVNWDTIGTGEIMLIQTIQSNNLQDTAIITVIINALPNPAFTGSKSTKVGTIEKYSSTADPSLLNFWSGINGDIQGNTNLTDAYILWSKAGNGQVKLVRVNSMTGCTDSSAIDVLISPVNNVREPNSANSTVEISPNPFDVAATISFKVTEGCNVILKLCDMLGNVIYTQEQSVNEPGTYLFKIDGSKINSGIYYATIWINGESVSKKIIVVH